MPSSNNPPPGHGLADLRLPAVRLRGEIAPPLTTPHTAMATNTSRQPYSQFSLQEIEDFADTASNISPTQPVQHGPPSPRTNYTSFPDPASVMFNYRLFQPPVDAEEEDQPRRSFRRRNALIPDHASPPNSLPTSLLSSNSTPLTSIHDDLSDQSPPGPRLSILQNTMRHEDFGSSRESSSSSLSHDSDSDRVHASDHIAMSVFLPPPPPSLSSSFNRHDSPSPQPLPSPLLPLATTRVT